MANAIVLNQLQLQYELENQFEINALKTKKYIDRLKDIDKLPFNKGIVYFSSQVWDFSKYSSLNIPKYNVKFNFELCPNDFHDDIKSYVLIKILENKNKIQSIHRKYMEICNFFKFLVAENVFSVYEITPSKISKYIERNEYLAPKSMRLLKNSILDFLKFYSTNYVDLLTNDIKKVLKQSSYQAFKAVCEEKNIRIFPKAILIC